MSRVRTSGRLGSSGLALFGAVMALGGGSGPAGCRSVEIESAVYACEEPSDCASGYVCAAQPAFSQPVCVEQSAAPIHTADGGGPPRDRGDTAPNTGAETRAGDALDVIRPRADACGPCPDSDIACRQPACQAGECVLVHQPDGTPCSYDEPCVAGMACDAGLCTGGAPVSSPLCGVSCGPPALSLAGGGAFGAAAGGKTLRGLAVYDGHAYLATEAAGLHVLRLLPDPTEPVEVAVLSAVHASDVAIQKDWLLAAGVDKLWLVDVQAPAVPVAQPPLALSGVSHVALGGSRAFAVTGSAELHTFTYGPGGLAQDQATVVLEATPAGPIAYHGDAVYAACGEAGVCVRITTGAQAPFNVVPTLAGGGAAHIVDVAPTDTGTWVLTALGVAAALDLDPSAPEEVSVLREIDAAADAGSGGWTCGAATGDCTTVHVYPDRIALTPKHLLITASSCAGVLLADVGSTEAPQAPEALRWLPVPGCDLDELAVFGPYVLVAGFEHGLHVVRIGCP